MRFPAALTVLSVSLLLCSSFTRASDTLDVTTRTIVVYADSSATAFFTGAPPRSLTSVCDFMAQAPIMLVHRAAMAREPMIRGLRQSQITATIDGMKVHAACVDMMDPVTAYIELENISAMEVGLGSGDLKYGANLGASINFLTSKPSAGSPPSAAADANYESNAGNTRLRADVNGVFYGAASRIGYTFRRAGDFTAGGGRVVNLSGFEKHNVATSLSFPVDSMWECVGQVIYDVATDIGYPSLIMDTRRAEALITSVTLAGRWSAQTESSFKVYGNIVDHLMDDYLRSVEEIGSRGFMDSMYMPMRGLTRTIGVLSETRFTMNDAVLSVILDAWRLDAEAVMDMVHLNSSIAPMRLMNIGNARIHNAGVSVSYDRMLSNWLLSVGGRIDFNAYDLLDPASVSVFSGFYPEAAVSGTAFAKSVSVTVLRPVFSNLTFAVTTGVNERLPSHLERYGFYLYQPQSNVVTTGRPDLNAERAWTSNVRAEYRLDEFRLAVSGFATAVENYIAPLIPADGLSMMRNLGSIGRVGMYGSEFSTGYIISSAFSIAASVIYTRARASDAGDNLPLIQPFSMAGRFVLSGEGRSMEVRLRSALAQNFHSTKILSEDATPGWTILDISGHVDVFENLTLRVNIANIFDRLYHEHTSINNVPSRGRSFNIGLQTRW